MKTTALPNQVARLRPGMSSTWLHSCCRALPANLLQAHLASVHILALQVGVNPTGGCHLSHQSRTAGQTSPGLVHNQLVEGVVMGGIRSSCSHTTASHTRQPCPSTYRCMHGMQESCWLECQHRTACCTTMPRSTNQFSSCTLHLQPSCARQQSCSVPSGTLLCASASTAQAHLHIHHVVHTDCSQLPELRCQLFPYGFQKATYGVPLRTAT